jgi:hypothetical protein
MKIIAHFQSKFGKINFSDFDHFLGENLGQIFRLSLTFDIDQVLGVYGGGARR